MRLGASDVLLLLVGVTLVFAAQLGFALRELGANERGREPQAAAKLAALFAVSVLAYVLIGFRFAYGASALSVLGSMAPSPGRVLVALAFACAVPAVVAGAIAGRARLWPQLVVAVLAAGLLYPLLERIAWGGRAYVQQLMTSSFGYPFHDFGGAMLAHGLAGWLALAALMVLGPRAGRFDAHGEPQPLAPASPHVSTLGIWLLALAWIGLNVLGSTRLPAAAGLVTGNALLAMAGGLLAALATRMKDTGVAHHGALAAVIAVSAGADVISPPAAIVVGAVAGALPGVAWHLCERHWCVDDVVGAWPVHGLAGVWGALACGVFGQTALGGQGGVSILSQALGTLGVIGVAIVSGFAIFAVLDRFGVLRAR